MPGLQVLVLYNLPSRSQIKGQPSDAISEEGVLRAVDSVAGALGELGYQADTFGVGLHLRTFLARLSRQRPDLVFNLCEGLGGEATFEYLIPGLLETEDIPYTGSGPAALLACIDKVRTKQILSYHGIPTPAFKVYEPDQPVDPSAAPALPVIVKPAHEDASLGIDAASVAHSEKSLQERIRYVHECYRQPALVERYIEGREFNVAVLGGSNPRSLPLAELDFSGLPPEHPRILSYEAKWIEDSPIYTGSPSVCPAPNVAPELAERIASVARSAYAIMGCLDYGRVDLRVDDSGAPYVLEVNPNPDLSPDAGLTKAAVAAGLGHRGLVQSIVESALARAADAQSKARQSAGPQAPVTVSPVSNRTP